MRVALIWTEATPLTGITVRYERYVRGLRALGHEAVTVCLPVAAKGYGEPVVLAPQESAFRDAGFYRNLQLDAAIVVSWLGLPGVLTAVKQACPWVVSIADSDGQNSPRVHAIATLRQSVLQHSGLVKRGKAVKYWLQRYLLGSGRDDRDRLDSANQANLIAINSPGARENLTAFFHYHDRLDLAQRIAVIPYPVDDCYLQADVTESRERRVVAIGRWHDPQKDAPLLAEAIQRTLRLDPAIGFDLVGPGGEAAFGRLCQQHSQVTYHGRQTSEVVVELLKKARSLVLSSRWESGPIVANEALSLGCTLIGLTRIPTLAAFCRTGRYGTASSGTSAKALAAAVLAETRTWDAGERKPAIVAATWRPRFQPSSVCQQLLHAGDLNWE